LTFGLRLKIPPDVHKGDILHLDVVQRVVRSERIRGGIAVQINIV